MSLYQFCFLKGHTFEEMANWSPYEKIIAQAFVEDYAERLAQPENGES